jgi:hypothetical protein
MAQGVEESFGSAVEDAKRRWYEARARAVADGQAAYERGRQIYADAIRAGRNVVARTPQEVRALGGAVNAGMRSAGNAASLGLADNLDAITGAAFGGGGSGNFAARYRNQLAEQHALDRQAAQDHRFATKAGNFLGTFGGIFAADAPVAAGAAARMIPGGAKALSAIQRAKRIGFVPEGLTTMAAVGGGTMGGVAQLATDAANGRRTSLQDFLGATGGGAVGGVGAIRRGPVLGAAIGGAVTAGLQGDSLDDVMRDATASAYGGRVLGTLGEQVSNNLPREMKGALGEGLSFAKSWARGETVPLWKTPSEQVALNLPKASGYAGPQQRIGLSKSFTRADWLTDWGRAIEAKFGVTAGLTRPQRRAVPELGDVYLPDHWLPSDIGNFNGGWLGPVAGQWTPEDGTPP